MASLVPGLLFAGGEVGAVSYRAWLVLLVGDFWLDVVGSWVMLKLLGKILGRLVYVLLFRTLLICIYFLDIER